TGPTGTATSTATSTSTATATGTATSTPTVTGTPGPICQDTYDPAGDLHSAKVIQPNAPQTHVLCPAGEEDWVYFGGLAGKVYTIDISQMDNGLDLSLGLYDSNGNLLAFNDDFPRNNDPTDLKPRIQSYRVTANGLYYVRIRDSAGGGGLGLTYTVVLNGESYGPTPTQIAELCTDLYEPDGLPEQARLMGIREVEKNNKLCPSGDADWTKMFMKVVATYRIRTDSHSLPGADPVMVLADRDGTTILDFNDDSNNTLDAQIDFSPPVDGFYYVQVKNVGDIGNQFISYDLYFEQLNVSGGTSPTVGATATTAPATQTATTTGTVGTPTATPTGTIGTPTSTATSTATGTAGTGTPKVTVTPCASPTPYPAPTPTQTAQPCERTSAAAAMPGLKGLPPFINGPAKQFIDPAMQQVWARTDQVVASQQTPRTWIWGPAGLWGRVELYHEANGGARQVQYFDKARMEITDWKRDRANPWFVTNGLLVQELVDGRIQIGDNQFVQNVPANIPVAGDEGDTGGPTYASFSHVLGRSADRTGATVNTSLQHDGRTGVAAAQPGADLVHYVPETGHNVPRVFWDFFAAHGPVGDGSHEDQLVDWVFAMGYPISEPYWTHVRIAGVERDVLVQAFQRRVLTYTPTNPTGWQVEMGNVGRHYFLWRYHAQP
ncbi:MAG: PPC domain-containing protein, partial [Herpetosiphonaceae bacterium]|nr:PPC domain-containing protein [Herpetosiphonaceae bacterium]